MRSFRLIESKLTKSFDFRSTFCARGQKLFLRNFKSFGSAAIRKTGEIAYTNSRMMISNGVNGCKNKMENFENCKRLAAYACVDENITSGQKIGVGTGTTSFYAVERLARKFGAGQLTDLVCVPTSYDSRRLIIENNLPLSSLDQTPVLDVYIDGADEVDERTLNCIKGGGGCLLEEKLVQSCSKKFFVVADYRKKSPQLGDRWKFVPLEVCRSAYVPLVKTIEKQEGGQCKLRGGTGKAGPVITDNGNFILDWHFPVFGPSVDDERWRNLNFRLKMLTGVVETGLFLGAARKAYFGLENGDVEILEAP